MHQHLIQDAKQALPMPDLWRKLGWIGEAKKTCWRPYEAEDTREKGSVFQTETGAWLFHDFVTGENFDEVSLLARVEGLSNGDACRRFLDLSGIAGVSRIIKTMPRNAATCGNQPHSAVPHPRRRPAIGHLEPFTMADVERVATMRGLEVDAVRLAALEGLLWRGNKLGHDSWVLTDLSRWNAQFRRFDGEPYYIGEGRAVKTLGVKGGWAAYPIGLPAITGPERKFQRVVIVEGMPDLLAGFQVILECGYMTLATVLCMTGASMLIPEDYLGLFAGLRVRIFADADAAGSAAAARWHRQLSGAGAIVDAFDLSGLLRADGRPVKDLNDVCLMDRGERESLDLMGGMLS
jgi:hypothetical protein